MSGNKPSGMAPSPPQNKGKTVHRNPNLVAKLAAESNGGSNPLLSRLYSSSLPAAPGAPPAGVPNILSQSAKKPEQQSAVEEGTSIMNKTAPSNPASKQLEVYKQTVYSESKLKEMLMDSTKQKKSGTVPARRQTPPSRLQPLVAFDESAVSQTKSATPALRTEPRDNKEEAESSSPLHVVSRFRTTTANTPKEFTYLTMRPRGIRDLYNPYDLQVVSHKEVDSQHYFTVSASGVTKFDDGESEFIELKAWEREHRVYHKLVQLDVFKNYKKWKSFFVWRKLVRRTTIQAYKNHLNDNLFHLHPNLSFPLREVRIICRKFQNWNIYTPSQETRTLDQYILGLQKTLNYIQANLNRTIDEVRDIIEKACKEAMNTATQVREKELQHGGMSDDKGRKSKKIDTRDTGAAHKPSYIELSQKRAVCRRLTAYIRLCDYMVINSLAALATKAVEDSHKDLQFPRPEKKVEKKPEEVKKVPHGHPQQDKKKEKEEKGPFEGMIFYVDVLFSKEDEAITVRPSIDSFKQKIEEIINEYISTVSGIKRFAQMEVFKVYTEHGMMDHGGDGEVGLGPDVGEMVTCEDHYKNLMQGIRTSLSKAFHVVDTYARTYDEFRKMYITNCALNTEAVRKADPSLEWFAEQLTTYKAQSQAIEQIPQSKDVAIFNVKTDRMKEFFTPSPINCLEAFHELLPIIAKEKNSALLEDLQACNKYLDNAPETVEAYVEYTDFYNKLEQRMDTVSADYDFLKNLFTLLSDEKIRIDENDETTYKTGTRPNFEKLRHTMQVVEDGKTDQVNHFARNIEVQLEDLRQRMNTVVEEAKNPKIEDENADFNEVIPIVEKLQDETNALLKREKELCRFQESFNVEPTPIQELREDVKKDIHDKVRLWTSLRDWEEITTDYSEKAFKELDIADIESQILKYEATAKQVSRTQAGNLVVPRLRTKVEEWQHLFPIIKTLNNPVLKDHHKRELDEVIGKIPDANNIEKSLSEIPDFTLGMLISVDVLHVKEEIKDINGRAIQEDRLEQMLLKVEQIWLGGGMKPQMKFQVNNHKDIKDLYVLGAGSVEEVMAQLEESTVVVSTIASSKFCVGGLKSRVDKWERKLRYMQDTLDKWLEFQRNWMYLENIFSSSEIRAQWKQDATTFHGVDRTFRDLMRRVNDLPQAHNSLLINANFDSNEKSNTLNLMQQFDRDNKKLENVLNSIEKQLEKKRNNFPRFYFLSNDDLLDILSKIKTPELIMPHMLKMFDGIKSLTFSSSNDITHLLSMEGESVELGRKNIKAGRGQVEDWLGELEKEMFITLRKLGHEALKDFTERGERTSWIFHHPVQLVLIISQMFWTRGCEESLGVDNSKELMKINRDINYRQLAELAGLTGKKLTKVERCVLSTLITLDVHGRDLVDEMYDNNVTRLQDFGWTKQLRVYWETDDADGQGNIFIRQNNSRFVYGYEYLGAQGRLVITPLTDRVYMTITGALKLYLGAAPAGPAGTGKTETTKDLAKNLARQCIVYNCSDGVTYKMMEKFFSGLIQTGAWTCLDEFNRINIEVLSVIASQVLEIKLALQSQQTSFTFQGTPNVPIRATYGAFITMNPGYAGRTELPDNLKILFRPVAVMTPDFRMIAEVILYSEGFKNAKDLSLKITQLYKLSSEQLSPQDHYDFGMRALKSILVMAGDLKRSQPDTEEDLTLIVACNDSNIPKFVAEDVPLFKGIMQDLFPGIAFPDREYDELAPAMLNDMKAKALVNIDTWFTKGIQFYETLIVRHGVMMVGVTGTGKSESRNVIAKALEEMHANGSTNPMARPVHQFVLNPKSVLMHELYGQLDVMTNEWRDGVLAVIAKNAVKDSEGCNDHRWIVFDGPVDTLWIESMNSVLDDSKLLCLDSGERIKLPDTIHMLFEVADLAVASPATVSRCGMVYVDGNDLPWSAAVGQWAETKLAAQGAQPQCRAYITSLFDRFMPQAVKWLSQQTSVLIGGGTINVVQSCCDLFTAVLAANPKYKFMADPQGDTILPPDDPYFKERNDMANILFAFSMTWSIGGNVDSATQENFDAFVRELLDFVPFPSFGLVFDFFVHFESRKFVGWEQMMKPFVYDPAVPFFDILVPTMDTVRYSYLAKTLVAFEKPLMFTGATGVGKSVIMTDCLAQNSEGLLTIIFQFSAQTSSSRTQELIESKLHKKRKNLFGAPPDCKVVLFIDDLNMPALETFGASPPIELLRQMMGNGGFYDRKIAGFWKKVQDVTVVTGAGPPEGGRNPVTARLTRLFHLFQIPNLSEDSMKRIFTSILSGFFAEKNFNKEVKDMAKNMISGSVEMFQRIRNDLRPRPTTPHYTFNLRDLAKVCQGLMQVVPRVCNNSTSGLHLWIHENMRCFYDRLTTEDDRKYFTEELLWDIIRRMFPGSHDYSDLFEKPFMWGDFFRFGAAAEDRVYEEISDMKKVYKLFDDYLDDYNTGIATSKEGGGSSTMNLVFFKDHCEHLARIIRIIRQPRGNALLVGVGGSGKRSLTRLATSIAEYKRFEIAVGKGYSMADFHESLLELYNTAGVKCLPLTFLLSDDQIVHEGMLEDVNNMLNSGEVPSLFSPDERDKKINATMEAAREKGFTRRDEIYAFFISRVRDNLHIVMCMSPVGDAFRTRCRQFPSLTNCCVIDWFNEWPREALSAVAERLMGEIDLGEQKDYREPLTKLCVEMHSSTKQLADDFWDELRRRYYITPTSYLEFINLYRALLDEKKNNLEDQLSRVVNGKKKMKETNETIGVMKKELEDKQPLLDKASKDNEILLEDLAKRQEKASVVEVQVSAQQAEAAEQQKQAKAIEADAKGQLDEAMPAVEAAIKALDAIDKGQITELKSLANPTTTVVKTVQAVMTMFEGTKIIEGWNGGMDWKGCKEFLGFSRLLDNIRGYDRDNIRPQNIARVQKFISDEEFTPDNCEKRGSAACRGLCIWVKAIDKYAAVAKLVAPKKAALAEAQQQLADTNAKLATAEAALKEVRDELAQLQENLDNSTRKKELLVKEVETCEKRLRNAESLSGSLKSEGARWEENIISFQERLKTLPLEIFLSSACIAYFGAFTAKFRKRLLSVWFEKVREVNLDPSNFTLVKAIGDPMEILSWQINSLPTDETSSENGIIVTMSSPPRRWPLMIDPQGQALKWLTQKHKASGTKCSVVKLTDKKYMRTIETAVQHGHTVLIDDVGETLDPALEPLLMRQIFTAEGGTPHIQLNAQSEPIVYDNRFRLFMCSKLPNPHYLPDVSIKVTIVNFTVTMDGLEDQMLGEVVAIEQRELEEEKNRLITSISEGQKQLKSLEEKILERLRDAKGNILDNEPLIQELKGAKQQSTLVAKRQEEAQIKLEEGALTRELYRTVANRCSILFFVLADLSNIDPMYQYSLDYFKRVVAGVVEGTERPANFSLKDAAILDEHLSNLKERITETTYVQVCRGLFNKDKIILSLLMGTSISRSAGDIAEQEWQYFVRATALASGEPPEKPDECDWVTPQQWELLDTLNKVVPALKGIQADVKARSELWKAFVQSEAPHEEVLPGGGTTTEDAEGKDWENSLTPFQKILLIRCWREEKLLFGLQGYIRHQMGKTFVEPPPFRLDLALADSSPTIPIVFILSQGADPMNMLQAFAKKNDKVLQYVSLGQGQGDNAKRLIETCRKSGDWAMLQNCHLSKTFMPVLETECANLMVPGASVNAAFRLWLTSMPVDFFPVSVLQNSVKLTNEPPTGLKANMVRCFNEIQESDWEVFTANEEFPECSKEHAYKKLVYGLCFFHSVVLERKKFGPLGWNVKYEWNDTDFHVSKQWLRLFFEEQSLIPWESLEYIIGQINYGGRVTDPQDRGPLITILQIYLNQNILHDGYVFSASGKYKAPPAGSLESIRTGLQEMSLIDSPEVFGMHENANLRYQLQMSQALMGTVLSIQPRLIGSKGGGPSPEELVMQKCIAFEEILPAPISKEEAGPTAFTTLPNGLPNSLSTVLSHELVKYNKLLKRMAHSLAEMQKALKGLTVLSEDLDKMYGSFLNDQVPALWSSVSYSSLKPLGSWFKELVQKVQFIRTWVHKGEPTCFWITGFFNPAAFMTGVLQAFARAESISVDKLGLKFDVTDHEHDEVTEQPHRGCYIYGIFTDAWRWDKDRKVMADSFPGEPYAQLPVVHFLPEPHHVLEKEFHRIPMYRTTVRAGVISSLGASSNYVLSIEARTDKDSNYWVLKGAAAVIALNY